MNEFLLTHEEMDAGYRVLKTGDYIKVGDLFQRRAGAASPAATGQSTRFIFERVLEDTSINGQKLAGMMYLNIYPVVLRPLGS